MIVPTAAFALAESLALVNPAGDRVHLLDPAARSIYQALVAGLSLDEVAAAIAGAAPCVKNMEQIQAELDILVLSWQQEGLVADSSLTGRTGVETAQGQIGLNISPSENGTLVTQMPGETEAPLSEVQSDRIKAGGDKPVVRQRLNTERSVYAGGDFRLHDLIFRITSEDATSWQAVLALYSHILEESEAGVAETVFSLHRGSDKSYTLVQDGKTLTNTNSRDTVVIALSAEIADLWHGQRDWMMIAHAAAVARDKDCFLMPGRGGSGKTTLAAALLCHGFTALADDIVPLCRNSGDAVALPLCMNIKQSSVDLLRRWYPKIDDLHPYPWGDTTLRFLPPPAFVQAAPGQTRAVSRVIFPCYKPGAATTLTPISATETFQRLVEAECMLGNPVEPARIAELVQWVQERPACTLVYDSLDEAVAVMRDLTDKAATPLPPPSVFNLT